MNIVDKLIRIIDSATYMQRVQARNGEDIGYRLNNGHTLWEYNYHNQTYYYVLDPQNEKLLGFETAIADIRIGEALKRYTKRYKLSQLETFK